MQSLILCLSLSTALADPRDLQLAINSDGHLRVSWKTDSPSINILVYSEEVADPSRLQTQGITLEAQREHVERDIFLHFVELQQLAPELIYIYQCGNSETGWSPIYSFRSLGALSRNPTFAVLGALESSEASQKALSQLSAHSLLDRLDLVFHFSPGPLSSDLYGVELLRAHIPFVVSTS